MLGEIFIIFYCIWKTLVAQWGLCVTWFPELRYPREKVIQLIINFCVTTQQDFYFFMLRDGRERKQILKRLYPATFALFGFEFACNSIIIEHLVSLLIRESMFYSLDFLVRKMNLLQSAIWESTATVTVFRNWTWHHAVCDTPVYACVWGTHKSYYFPIGLKLMQELHWQGQPGLHHLLITVMAKSTQPGTHR